jgi:hypothetical protein
VGKTQASKLPACRTVTVHTFRGDRTPAYVRSFYQGLDDQRKGVSSGPSRIDCLLYAGHTGVSMNGARTVYGFNPDIGKDPLWQALAKLRSGDAYPGIVLDDSNVFQAAQHHGVNVITADVVLPHPSFQEFERRLLAESRQSRFSYGFPDGDGDCNCTTWLERLALPLLTGSMDEFTALLGFATMPSRRFGRCVSARR